VIRSQQAVVLAVFLNLAAAAVALGRHSANWINEPSRSTVLLALGSIALASVAAQIRTTATWRTLGGSRLFPWKHVASIAVLVIAVLSFCPEWPIYSSSVTAHALTVACGAMIVLVPMRFLLREIGTDRSVRIGRWLTRREWVSVAAGILFGAMGFWSSTITGQTMFRHFGFADMILAGLLLAYAFLGQPLGLLRSKDRSHVRG
jgi:hypothetical protein